MAMSTSTRLALVAVVLVAAASGTAAAKCTRNEADVSKTTFSLTAGAASNYSMPGKGKKPETPYNRFCFKIASDAKYNGTSCSSANGTSPQCCVTGDAKFNAATVKFTVEAGCNSKDFAKAAFFALSATAQDKKSKEISSSFKTKDGVFEIKVKSKTSLAGGKDLCLNVPADAAAPCKTLAQVCGGACRYDITTTSFKPAGEKKKQTCCITGSVLNNNSTF